MIVQCDLESPWLNKLRGGAICPPPGPNRVNMTNEGNHYHFVTNRETIELPGIISRCLCKVFICGDYEVI